jgi:uncharacterized RDD family membrane protein YckC
VLAALAAQGPSTPQLQPVSGWSRLVAALLEPILMIVTLGIGWLIWAVIITGSGQTPAKKVMGHRVVDVSSRRPVGFARMFFMRYLIGGFVANITFLFTLGIIVFMPFWDSRKQNIWDKVSSTQVVHA